MGWYKRQQTKSSDQEDPATLADMIHEGLSIFCWCNRCGHNSTIDPVPLTNVLGSFFPVPELGGRMRCSLCKARDITTRPAWPNHGSGQLRVIVNSVETQAINEAFKLNKNYPLAYEKAS